MRTIDCPSCGKSLMVDVRGRNSIFCSYCGEEIELQDENSLTKNISVKKDIKVHKRYTDDADVIRAQTEAYNDKNSVKIALVAICILFLIPTLIFGIPELIDYTNRNEGKINAGYYKDLIGEDYKTVQSHFEAAGFTEIELIDLHDSGIAVWQDGKVKIISVGGNTKFDSSDYFEPETKVVISYH